MSDVKHFTQFIESNSYLLDFFTEFPSKLMELLLKDTPLATFIGSDTIELDIHRLNAYLKSDESIFNDIDSITDFLEAMAIIGFYRVPFKQRSNDTRSVIRLKNSAFKSNRLPPVDLYKRESEANTDKKSKRKSARKEKLENSTSLESIKLLHDLNRKSMRELKMTSLEFSRVQMNMLLLVKRGFAEKRTQPDVIDFQMTQPDYMKSGEIAGFYGDTTLDDLKKAFGTYLPVYTADSESEVVDIVAEVIEIDNAVPQAPKKPRRKYKPRKRKIEIEMTPEDDNSQQSLVLSETPKRKNVRRTPRYIMPEETEQAVDFIQKENSEQEKEEILEFLCDLNSGNL